MKLLAILLVVALAAAAESSAVYSQEKTRSCGRQLAQRVLRVCYTEYESSSFKSLEEQCKHMKHRVKRSAPGMFEDCCENPCDDDYIRSHCDLA